MDSGKQFGWTLAFAFLGVLMTASLIAYFFADAWLAQLDGTAREIAQVLSEDYRNDVQDMKTIRTLGMMGSLGGIVGFLVAAAVYSDQKDDLKNDIIGMVFLGGIVLGFGGIRLMGSENFREEAISTGIAVSGLVVLLSGLLMGLIYASKDDSPVSAPATEPQTRQQREQPSTERNPNPSGSSKRAQYCTSCGEEVGDDHEFCPYCGTETVA